MRVGRYSTESSSDKLVDEIGAEASAPISSTSLSDELSVEYRPTLIRPSGTFSPQGRRHTSLASRLQCLLPLWEKVAKPDEGEATCTGPLNSSPARPRW